jgi:hypothetical protein
MQGLQFAVGGVGRLAVLGTALGLGTSLCEGQTLIHRFDGSELLDAAGTSVGGGFDVDADGVADVIVGLPFSDAKGLDAGAARVYSGATGELIHEFGVTQWYAYFGGAVACVGDLDGDGFSELFVGAQYYDFGGTDCGAAFVFSGKTGAQMKMFGGS